MSDKKRREPEPVAPVEIGGMRYEAPFEGALYGFQQDGGIVAARTISTGALEWTQLIYRVPYDPDMEDDKQDVFISGMVPADDGSALLIENEHGAKFRLKLSDRSVIEIDAGVE